MVIRTIDKNDMDFIQKLWGDEETMLSSGGVYNVRDEDKDALYGILNKGPGFNNHYIILHDAFPCSLIGRSCCRWQQAGLLLSPLHCTFGFFYRKNIF